MSRGRELQAQGRGDERPLQTRGVAHVLEEDPELGAGLEGERLHVARQCCRAPIMRIPAGPWREPEWPRGRALRKQVLALIAFVAYAYLLEPLGFVASTFLAVAVLGRLLGARLWQAAAAGAAIAIVLFVLFDTLLSLPLPAGVLGFLG